MAAMHILYRFSSSCKMKCCSTSMVGSPMQFCPSALWNIGLLQTVSTYQRICSVDINANSLHVSQCYRQSFFQAQQETASHKTTFLRRNRRQISAFLQKLPFWGEVKNGRFAVRLIYDFFLVKCLFTCISIGRNADQFTVGATDSCLQ